MAWKREKTTVALERQHLSNGPEDNLSQTFANDLWVIFVQI
jgi:hypothetical protein